MQMPNSHQKTTKHTIEPAETDESGSLRFQAPKKEDTLPVTERKVCFSGRVRCRRSIAPPMNPENTWYSTHEIASFRIRDKQLQSVVTSGAISVAGDNDTIEVSFVGLLSQEERKQIMKRTKEAKSCVLDEQMQQEDGFYNHQDDIDQSFKLDQESMADFYSIYSKRAIKVAQMKGLQVSWHVKHSLEEESIDMDDCKRSRSQRSKSITTHRPERNSSIPSAGFLVARLTY